MSYRKGQRGIPLIEIGVVLVLAMVITILLFRRVALYQELAEKTAMELTVMQMQTMLRLEKARLYAAGKSENIQQLTHSNPIRLLEQPPANYLGEQPFDPALAEGNGEWVFNTLDHRLYYLPNKTSHLNVAAPCQTPCIRFELNSNKKTKEILENHDIIKEVELLTLEKYQWFQ